MGWERREREMGGSEGGVKHQFTLACIYLYRRVQVCEKATTVYLSIGENEFPGSVDMFCTLFLHLHYQITILSQTTKVGPVAVILCMIAITHYMMLHGTNPTGKLTSPSCGVSMTRQVHPSSQTICQNLAVLSSVGPSHTTISCGSRQLSTQ